MATKSMTKNVVVRSKPLARNFIRAVENAERKTGKDVFMTRSVHELKGSVLKEMFSKK